MKKLDYAFANFEWQTTFQMRWYHIWIGGVCSDHKPVLIDYKTNAEGLNAGRPQISRFHFHEAWEDETEYREIIEECWQNAVFCVMSTLLKQRILNSGKKI